MRATSRSRVDPPSRWSLSIVAAAIALGAFGACSSSSSSDENLGHGSAGPGATSGGGDATVTGAGGATGAGGGVTGAGGDMTSAGGASATTGTSGAGGGASDPCAGAGDGAHCGSELGGSADHGSLYQCQGGVTASAMGCPYGCEASACQSPPPDPCASAASGNGLYCGGNLSGGDANTLYDCENGSTASKQTCPNGCLMNPPGVADACKSAGDPCANASSGDGAYCGSSLGAGNANTLYQCQNETTASSQPCPAGCQQNPPGVADACKPNGGQCCLNHPPGVVTQPFTACGNGGSHYGIDYGTPIGTPIYAGISGTVVGSALGFPNCYDNGCSQSCWNSFNCVKIESDCGDPANGSHDLYVYYLHINDLAPGIGNGSHVDQGQLVAYSGSSGCSSGPHIHIETVSVPSGQSAVLNTCNSVDPSSRYCPGQ